MRQILAFVVALSVVNFGILVYLILPDSPDPASGYTVPGISNQGASQRQLDDLRRDFQYQIQKEREHTDWQRNFDKMYGR